MAGDRRAGSRCGTWGVLAVAVTPSSGWSDAVNAALPVAEALEHKGLRRCATFPIVVAQPLSTPPPVTPHSTFRLVVPGYSLEIEREADDRWIAEVMEVPGVLVYGATPEEARIKVQALLLRVLADRVEHGELQLSAPA